VLEWQVTIPTKPDRDLSVISWRPSRPVKWTPLIALDRAFVTEAVEREAAGLPSKEVVGGLYNSGIATTSAIVVEVNIAARVCVNNEGNVGRGHMTVVNTMWKAK